MSGLPKVSITFKEAARKAVIRSARGAVGLILKESTVPTTNPIVVTAPSEIPAALSAANKTQIEKALIGNEKAPRKIVCYFVAPGTGYTYTVVTPGSGANPKTSGWYEKSGDTYVATNDETVTEGKTYYEKSSSEVTTVDYSEACDYFLTTDINYLAAPTVATDGNTDSMKAWVKSIHDQPEENYGIIAILPNCAADCEFIVNYTNTSVKDNDGNTFTAEGYCARIAGLLATTPMNSSSTYTVLPELAECSITSREEAGTKVDLGQLVIFFDGEKCKIARGVNSFVTTTATKSAVYTKIKVVDTMEQIKKDIGRAAEDSYIGKFSNNYDNKGLLINAINEYFGTLIAAGGLNNANCEIDLDANRAYLRDKGIDVSTLTDQEIREYYTDDKVFLAASMTILDAMEDITLNITI